MTTHNLRIIVEKVNSKTDEVIARNTISSFDITKPKNIVGLDLRHTEQINLLQSMQDCLLKEQSPSQGERSDGEKPAIAGDFQQSAASAENL